MDVVNDRHHERRTTSKTDLIKNINDNDVLARVLNAEIVLSSLVHIIKEKRKSGKKRKTYMPAHFSFPFLLISFLSSCSSSQSDYHHFFFPFFPIL